MTHNFEKEYNKAGWIFADYKNKFNYTDWNIVIYGHNMKSDLMFGTLKNVLNKEWYENEENKFITLTTVDGIWKFEVFSVYEEKASDYPIQTDFKSDSKYLEFIKNIKSKSIYDFNVDVSATTGILTLSTCGSDSSNRIVVHAKKVN